MSLDNVDRAIMQQLRRRVVALGYLPDITLYSTAEQYANAKVTLKNSLPDKTLIEVFGVGNSQSRQEKTDGKITVDRLGIKESNISYIGATRFEKKEDGSFTKLEIADAIFDVDYEVRVIGTTVKMDRLFHNIVFQTFGTRKYLPHVGENGQDLPEGAFWLDYTGTIDITRDKFIEKVFRYTARNIFLTEDKVLNNNVPALVEINMNIVPLQQDLEISDGGDIVDEAGEVLINVTEDLSEQLEQENSNINLDGGIIY